MGIERKAGGQKRDSNHTSRIRPPHGRSGLRRDEDSLQTGIIGMGNQIKRIVIVFFFFQVFAGYSAADADATNPESVISRSIVASKQDLFHAADKILAIQGFKIRLRNEKTGILSTAPSPMRLNLSGCECGLTMGPIEDERPIITVSIDVAADENLIFIQAHIIGKYPKKQISERMIQDDLFDQISRYLD